MAGTGAAPTRTPPATGGAAVRRRLEPDARRAQILSCAVRLFGSRSYDQVSTGDVAAAAGVARGLVNHYFGTKAELYLEVVRALLTVPDVVLDVAADGDLDARVDATVTWFLDAVGRHSRPWLMAIGATGPGNHPDVATVIAQADEVTVDRILALAGWDPRRADVELRAAIRAYIAFARAGAVQWLVQGALSRPQTHLLLTRALVTLLTDIAPRLRDVPGQPAGGPDPAEDSTATRSRSRLRRKDGPTSASI